MVKRVFGTAGFPVETVKKLLGMIPDNEKYKNFLNFFLIFKKMRYLEYFVDG